MERDIEPGVPSIGDSMKTLIELTEQVGKTACFVEI